MTARAEKRSEFCESKDIEVGFLGYSPPFGTAEDVHPHCIEAWGWKGSFEERKMTTRSVGDEAIKTKRDWRRGGRRRRTCIACRA